MFDAYKIAIKISMINAVSPQLDLLKGQFARLGIEADIFRNKLNKIKSIAMVGGTLFGAGIFGMYGISKIIKPAMDYQHQLNILNMAGLTQVEIAQAVSAAWKNTHDVITTTATGNLRTFTDMRNVLGSTQEAIELMPMVTKMQAVLMSSKEGAQTAQSADFAFSVAKALDIIGAASSPQEFTKQATEMSKVITAFQGRVTPYAFQQTFAIARQAKLPLDDEFKYRYLPTLMLEYSNKSGGSGGSKGVGPMLAAMYRVTNQGYINKKALPLLEKLGLVDPNTALLTTTSGTTVGAFKGSGLAAHDPFIWVQKVLMPAIYKEYGKNVSKDTIQQTINELFRGNQLAAALVSEYALKAKNFYRDAAIIQKAMSIKDAYQIAIKNDPALAYEALHAQWTNLETAMALPIASILIPTLFKLADWFNNLTQILIKYPSLAKILTYSFIGLSASLMFSGTIALLVAGFKGLALIMSVGRIALMALGPAAIAASLPVLGIIAGITLVGIALYKIYNVFMDLKNSLSSNGWINNLKLFNEVIYQLVSIIPSFLTFGAFNPSLKKNQSNMLPLPLVSLLTGGVFGAISNILFPDKKTSKPVANKILKVNSTSPILNKGISLGPQKTNNISPIANKKQSNQQNTTIVMKINDQVLGHAVLKHMNKNVSKAPSHTSNFDTSMNLIPVLMSSFPSL